MKTTYKIAAVALMLGFAVQANAQETAEATATANATIITPIAIEQVADMHFGEIVATAAGGTVVLSTSDSRTATGVQLPANTGTVNAASFTVTGSADYAYSITLPANGYEIKTGDGLVGKVMTIGTWLHNANELLPGGTETFKVGATLTLVADQAAGIYIGETPFEVSVAYN